MDKVNECKIKRASLKRSGSCLNNQSYILNGRGSLTKCREIKYYLTFQFSLAAWLCEACQGRDYPDFNTQSQDLNMYMEGICFLFL
jgi:hypothetical protein